MALQTTTRMEAPREIERLFQGSLFLLIVTGFTTLAATGKLDLVSVVFVLLVLALRAYQLLSGAKFSIPKQFVSYLSVFYVLLFFTDFFLFSGRNFVTPSVHLVLFGMCVKMFSVERDRDYVYLGVLSFLMVLSAAVLTVDTLFLGIFCVFILLAVFSFMTLEMRRAAMSATNAGRLTIPELRKKKRTISSLRRLSSSLSGASLFMVVGILLLGVGLFFTIPRVSGGYLSRFAQRQELTTGFSDTVNLGAIGRIQQSSEIVAHVTIEGDTTGSHSLRLRGAALSLFDGKRWQSPPHDAILLRQGYGRAFQLGYNEQNQLESNEPARIARSQRRDIIRYRILMEPMVTPVLFTIPTAEELFGNFRQITVDADHTFRNIDREHMTSVYDGISDIAEPTAKELARAGGPVPGNMPPMYLQLPRNLDPRISELARSVTTGKKTQYGQAEAIQQYLGTHFGYTLQLPTESPVDPIADFLFRRKQGHCEYFASSMAVMLRSLGIPSRIITGFRGAEFNQVSGAYIVRARDAHSWVEAYLPGAGWVAFDPTPPGPEPVVNSWTRIRQYLDAAREFWREWIVNYDSGHQQSLTIATVQDVRVGFERLRTWSVEQYERLLRSARKAHDVAQREPQKILRPSGAVIVILVVVVAGFALLRIASVRKRRGPVNVPSRLATRSYQRMVRKLAKRGYQKQKTQTPNEFAASIPDQKLSTAVRTFTETYERARFGESAEDANRLDELLRTVESVRD